MERPEQRWVERARHLLSLGKYSEALKDFYSALDEEGPSAQLYAEISQTYELSGNLEQANEWAEKALAMPGPKDFAYFRLALGKILLADLPAAWQALRAALELEPNDPKLHLLQAYLHLIQREWEPARLAAEEGLKFDPDNVELKTLHTNALLAQEDASFETVELHCLSLLKHSPENVGAHVLRGWSRLLVDTEAAKGDFQRALALDPNSASARRGLMATLRGSEPAGLATELWILAEHLELRAWEHPVKLALAQSLLLLGLVAFLFSPWPPSQEAMWWSGILGSAGFFAAWCVTSHPSGNFLLLSSKHARLLYPAERFAALCWGAIFAASVACWFLLPWKTALLFSAFSIAARTPLCAVDLELVKPHRRAVILLVLFLTLGWGGSLLSHLSLPAAQACWLGAIVLLPLGMSSLSSNIAAAFLRSSLENIYHDQS